MRDELKTMDAMRRISVGLKDPSWFERGTRCAEGSSPSILLPESEGVGSDVMKDQTLLALSLLVAVGCGDNASPPPSVSYPIVDATQFQPPPPDQVPVDAMFDASEPPEPGDAMCSSSCDASVSDAPGGDDCDPSSDEHDNGKNLGGPCP